MSKGIYQKLSLSKIIIIGLIVRLFSWPWTYHGDINATYWWGKFAAEFSWRGFYDWLYFGGHGIPDQPMLNIYYNWGIRQIYLFFYNIFWFLNQHISLFPSKFMQWYFLEGNQILLKLPMIIADILLVYFCYKFTKSKLVALVLSLYPPLIYNSAVWGSGDSIINLLALLGFYFLWKKKYIPGALFYISSVLYKPSLLVWAIIIPIILIKNKIKSKDIILSATVSLLFIYVICSPFNPIEVNPLLWFFNIMTTKILPGIMDQVTANAMNLWALIFGLKPKLDEFLILNTISARNFSIIICVIFYFIILLKLFKKYTQKNLLLTLVTISMVTFTFMTRMHERYTFPALIPLLILAYKDRRFIKYFIILSVTHMINVYSGWWMPNISFLVKILDNDFVVRSVSLINIIITLRLVFFSLDIKNANTSNNQPPPPKLK
ncbi:MAG: hypothetical protein PHX34_04995 [Candidatus Shapirobacteria bacterium]|nr:hypothetical protein [Candidatus Shapirobacteria bacterium]